MAMIDYGALVFCDGVFVNQNEFFQDMKKAVGWDDRNDKERHVSGNNFAYIGNEKITFAFYKTYVTVAIDKNIVGTICCLDHYGRKSITYTFGKYNIHIKLLGRNCFATTTIDGKHYNVIYGYGIEPNMQIWNKIKYQYLGKKNAHVIDKLIHRFWYKR